MAAVRVLTETGLCQLSGVWVLIEHGTLLSGPRVRSPCSPRGVWLLVIKASSGMAHLCHLEPDCWGKGWA